MSERYPFSPFPSGWYHVASLDELPPRKVLPLRALGRDLVLFRTKGGEAALLDAHCPHQGAHLGHGGRVIDETLRCPFHGWRFGADGRCALAAGADAIPRGAEVARYPLLERGGGLVAGFAGERGELPPQPDELEDGVVVLERAWDVRAHVHEAVENLVDAAHFAALHHTPSRPRTTFEPRGDEARIESRLAMASLEGDVATTLDARGVGLGWWVLRFGGIADVTVLTTATPIDAERLSFRLRFVARGDPEAAASFARSVCVQVDQDKLVWEHKVYREAPLLTAADGPIAEYRAWARRFY